MYPFILTVWHAYRFLIKYSNGWRAYCMQKYHRTGDLILQLLFKSVQLISAIKPWKNLNSVVESVTVYSGFLTANFYLRNFIY